MSEGSITYEGLPAPATEKPPILHILGPGLMNDIRDCDTRLGRALSSTSPGIVARSLLHVSMCLT